MSAVEPEKIERHADLIVGIFQSPEDLFFTACGGSADGSEHLFDAGLAHTARNAENGKILKTAAVKSPQTLPCVKGILCQKQRDPLRRQMSFGALHTQGGGSGSTDGQNILDPCCGRLLICASYQDRNF